MDLLTTSGRLLSSIFGLRSAKCFGLVALNLKEIVAEDSRRERAAASRAGSLASRGHGAAKQSQNPYFRRKDGNKLSHTPSIIQFQPIGLSGDAKQTFHVIYTSAPLFFHFLLVSELLYELLLLEMLYELL